MLPSDGIQREPVGHGELFVGDQDIGNGDVEDDGVAAFGGLDIQLQLMQPWSQTVQWSKTRI